MSKYYKAFNGYKISDPDGLTADIEDLTILEQIYLHDFYESKMKFGSNYKKADTEELEKAINESGLKCILLNFGFSIETKPLYNNYAMFTPLDIEQQEAKDKFNKLYAKYMQPKYIALLKSILPSEELKEEYR